MVGGLESARRKILRAMKHRQPIEEAIADYRSRHPYTKIIQPNSAPQLKITEQPPIEIAIIAGEILYQLRSALDHLFFDLVRKNFIGPFCLKELKRIQFPLLPERPKGIVSPVPIEAFKFPYYVRIAPDHFALIEGLQPYHHGAGFHELMRMLHVFSNIDKHRYLQTGIAVINRRHTIISKEGFTDSVVVPMLQDGAELYEPAHFNLGSDSAMEVQDEYAIEIAFDEPEFGPLQTAPIEKITHGLPALIFSISVQFQKFFS